MMPHRILLLLLAVTVFAGEASAAAPNNSVKSECFDERSARARKIQTCTTIIDDARAGPADRFMAYVARGRAYFAENDWSRSIEDFDAAIRLHPDVAELYNERGVAYDRQGDRERAITDYFAAIRIKPDYATAYGNRGLAHYKSGSLDLAQADFDTAIRLNPRYAVAYNGRGIIFSKRGDHQRAIADFTTAIRLDPNYANAYNNRGIVNASAGDFSRAIADLKEAIRLASSNPDFHNELAWTFVRAGNPSAGLPYAERALQLEPNHANALDTRGAIHEALGDTAKALADYRRALLLNPALTRTAEAATRLERSSTGLASLSDVIQFVEERGWMANFDNLCAEFELAPKTDKCIFRQVSVQETEGRGDPRGFNVPAGGGSAAPYVLIFHLGPLVGEFFVASPEGKLIRAYYRSKGAGYSRVENEEAEQEFQADLTYWRTNLARLKRGLETKGGRDK